MLERNAGLKPTKAIRRCVQGIQALRTGNATMGETAGRGLPAEHCVGRTFQVVSNTLTASTPPPAPFLCFHYGAPRIHKACMAAGTPPHIGLNSASRQQSLMSSIGWEAPPTRQSRVAQDILGLCRALSGPSMQPSNHQQQLCRHALLALSAKPRGCTQKNMQYSRPLATQEN